MIDLEIKKLSIEIQEESKHLFSLSHLKVESPSVYPIVGNNGVGKSTFLKTLVGIQPNNKGEIFWRGEDILNVSSQKRARIFSLLLTERPSFSWLKVSDLIEWTLDSFVMDLREKNLFKDEVLEEFNIKSFMDTEFSKLSDGQKQKVLLARCFCQQTPIVLLDEPTTFLDIKAKHHLLNELSEWSKKWNKVIFFCSHEWPWISKNHKEILYIDDDQKKMKLLSPQVLIETDVYPSFH